MEKQIRNFIKKAKGRMTRQTLLSWLLWFVPAGVLLAALFELVACMIPWYSVHWWSLGALCAGVLAAGILTIIRAPKLSDAAKALDRGGLQERAQTALELLQDNSLFSQVQKQDTWNTLQGISLRRQIPTRIGWQRPVGLLVAGILFAVTAFLPTAAKEQAKDYHELLGEIAES